MSINHHQEQKQTLEASKNRLELYRLEVERLRVALDEETNTRQVYGEQIRELRAQRDVLLMAAKELVGEVEAGLDMEHNDNSVINMRAAIKAVG